MTHLVKPRRQRRLVPSARLLRQEMIDAEAKLWWRLRRGQLGFPFRGQEPLGPFIAPR